MAKHQIERSAGIPIHGTAYVAGGGWSGEDKKVDRAVQNQARALEKAFGGKVQIRFNSNRRSGGAFLVNSEKNGFDVNCDVGFNAGTYTRDGVTTFYRELYAQHYTLNEIVKESKNVRVTEGWTDYDGKYHHGWVSVKVRGPKAGIDWLKKHVKPEYLQDRKVQ